MTCIEYQELAALLAMDVLDASERPAVAGHVAICPACSGVMADMVVATGALAYAAPARSPRPELKQRLMTGLRTAEPPKGGVVPAPPVVTSFARPQASVLPWVAAAAVLVAVGLGGKVAQQGQQLALLQNQQGQLAEQIDSMAQERAAATHDAEMLAGQDVRMVAMQSQPVAHSAQAWVYWSPARHAWLATFKGLPEAGSGKTYQLWAVTQEKKLSMGTFTVDEHGVARVRATLPEGGKPMAAAVTLEPAGGVPSPTGPMVMVGPIKQL